MAPTCLYSLPLLMSLHMAFADKLGLIPVLDQGISELLDSVWRDLVVSDARSRRFQLGLGQGNKRASQWHPWLSHPGAAYRLWPQNGST